MKLKKELILKFSGDALQVWKVYIDTVNVGNRWKIDGLNLKSQRCVFAQAVDAIYTIGKKREDS